MLCLGNILYCGLVAIRQKDLNLLIGNSSVAHMGFVFLGIASFSLVGVTGAVVVMIAHGFLAALTFGVSGYLYQQTKSLDMTRMGGLLQRLPFVGAALIMAMLAGCGVPGFANFVGEAMVFFGSWKALPLVTGLAVWGGLIIGAVYMLRAIRNILHGPVSAECAGVADAPHAWRRLPFVLLLAALLVFGFFPGLLTEKIAPSARGILATMGTKATPVAAFDPVQRDVDFVVEESVSTGGLWKPTTITVRTTNSLIFVGGEVKRPGVITYVPGLKISQLIAATGGLTDYGAARQVRVTRGNGVTEVVDLVAAGRDASKDFVLSPDDRVNVPKRIIPRQMANR
jgi:NADH:ubiquinone oxidoreductase subunit 5 (subunit L)/multisubunit Na+/H+ antiporter MnhA subunit